MPRLRCVPNYLYGMSVYPFASMRMPHYKILTIEETLRQVGESRLSIARFGDGELRWMLNHESARFQSSTPELAFALKAVLRSPADGCLVCIPPQLIDLKGRVTRSRAYWSYCIGLEGEEWSHNIDKERCYGNTDCSRFYITYSDKRSSVMDGRVELWHDIWRDRSVLVVEGSETRLGLGNDLLSGAVAIRRIVVPPKNAFRYRKKILSAIARNVDEADLILLAMGPTATVVANDLCGLGFQALDVGHLDLEFGWYRMKARHKVPLADRLVNELGEYASAGRSPCQCSQIYEREVVEVVS